MFISLFHSAIFDQATASRRLARNLVEAYLPEAKAFCSMIADALASTTDELMNQSGKTTLHPDIPSKLTSQKTLPGRWNI